jgi:hypothetical protein
MSERRVATGAHVGPRPAAALAREGAAVAALGAASGRGRTKLLRDDAELPLGARRMSCTSRRSGTRTTARPHA